ncbi:MAG: hypothetical protein GF315_08560 [candidate division Zixibacteria bacterium]|nr:hypothetical protein [candidate division Zixibacteria bacterium]
MDNLRLACILIPNFPMEVLLKGKKLHKIPAGIVEEKNDISRLEFVNNLAAKFGILVGMSVAQAKMIFPELRIESRDLGLEKEESETIYNSLVGYSPRIEVEQPGIYFADIHGLKGLFGDEQELASKISETIRSLSYPVRIGIANDKTVARIAAASTTDYTINAVRDNESGNFVGNLPINYLKLPGHVLETVKDLGLYSLDQIRNFNQNELTTRFGREGLIPYKLAKGDKSEYFNYSLYSDKLSQRICFDNPLYDTESVLFFIEELLKQLIDQIIKKGHDFRTLETTLVLEDRIRREIKTVVDRSTIQKSKFIRQLRMDFERERLQSGVKEIITSIPELRKSSPDQLELNTGYQNKQAQLDDEIKLFSFEFKQDNIPEKEFEIIPIKVSPNSRNNKIDHQNHYYTSFPVAGLRLFKSPKKLKVIGENETIRNIQFENKNEEIREQQGPWEVSSQWWSEDYNRHYYEVQTSESVWYLIYNNRDSDEWFLQGLFD